MSKSKDKNFGFSVKPRSGENLTKEEKKLRFMKGILNSTNLSEESRLNLLGSLEGTANEAQLMKIAISNNATAIARSGGQEKGKAKEASLIGFYEANPRLHLIKSSSEVARQIIRLKGHDRSITENQFGKQRTIAEKIREYRKTKK